MGWDYAWFYEKHRDGKPHHKPSKIFKVIRRRRERAQVKDAMRNGSQIPLFKKSDEWDWN